MITSKRINLLRKIVEQLNGDQRAVFENLVESLDTRRSEISTTTPNGDIFSLHGTAGTGKTYTLKLEQQCAESNGHNV